LRGDPANPHGQAALLKLDTFAELHAVAPAATYSKGWVMRGITRLATGDAAPAVAYRAGAFISTASWAKGTRPGDTGRCLWHGGSNGVSHSVACIAPEIDFAVLVAGNRGLDIAIWKTRQAVKALIRAFAPKRTSGYWSGSEDSVASKRAEAQCLAPPDFPRGEGGASCRVRLWPAAAGPGARTSPAPCLACCFWR
jgi:hypothetical protein